MSLERIMLSKKAQDQHQDLMDALNQFNVVMGNETLFDDVKLIGMNALSRSAVLAGKGITELNNLFTVGTRKAMVKFGTNRQAISVLSRDIPKRELKEEVVLPASFVNNVTSEGDLSTVIDDTRVLGQTLDLLVRHLNDIDGYLKQQLGYVKDIGNVRTNDQGVALIQKYDKLSYPPLQLPIHANFIASSHPLPGGKILTYDDKRHVYSMSGKKPHGEAQPYPAQLDAVGWLRAVNGVNDHLQRLIKYMYEYNTFVKNWASAVKSAYPHLEREDNLSESVSKQLERMLDGNVNIMQLYSGLLPRLIGYTDKYIQDVLGSVNKLLN